MREPQLEPVTDDLLRRITDAIVGAVNPVKVILFGSYARGNARQDSDVDLLVVEERPFGPDHSRRADFGRILRALADVLVPIDVLLFSRGEVERFAGNRSHIIAEALREGRVLHERA